MCAIPITRCTLPNGKKGFRYGQSGKCYENGQDAAKQGIAIEGGPEKFKKVMKSESGANLAFAKAALEEYEKEAKAEKSNSFKSIASFLSSKSDDYGKDTTEKIKDGDEADPQAKADLSDGKPSEMTIDTYEPSNSENGLDNPVENPAANIVVPPYNKSASPVKSDIKEMPEKEDILKKTISDSMDSAMCEEIWSSVAYISQKERDKVADEDFAGPHRSFPIRNEHDVHSASKLIGHGANPTSIKRKIIQIAKRKGLEHALPDSWKSADQHSMAYEQALALLNKLTPEEKQKLKLN